MDQLKNLSSSDLTTLFGSADLEELVATMANLEKGLRGWLLLHPAGRRSPILLSGRDQFILDAAEASALRGISFPEVDETVTKSEGWTKVLAGILAKTAAQVVNTDLFTPIRVAGSLVAIAGFSEKGRRGGMSAKSVIQSVAQAIRRLHEMDALRQDVEMHKHLMLHWAMPIVMVTATSKVMGGTEGGLTVLKELQAKATKGEEDSATLPAVLRRAVVSDQEDASLGNYKAHLSHPPLFRFITTVERPIKITLSKTTFHARNQHAVANLTPSEQKVHVYLMQGDRNKQIADKLKISVHTVRHHVSAILRKFNCSDRLLLVARAAAPLMLEPKTVAIPALMPPTSPLPPARYLNVTAREMG